jgi:hypothetical protein
VRTLGRDYARLVVLPEERARPPCQFPDPEAARRAILEYVETFYDRRRPHSGLGFLTPARAYAQMARAA